jgi:hypothetical protein
MNIVKNLYTESVKLGKMTYRDFQQIRWEDDERYIEIVCFTTDKVQTDDQLNTEECQMTIACGYIRKESPCNKEWNFYKDRNDRVDQFQVKLLSVLMTTRIQDATHLLLSLGVKEKYITLFTE